VQTKYESKHSTRPGPAILKLSPTNDGVVWVRRTLTDGQISLCWRQRHRDDRAQSETAGGYCCDVFRSVLLSRPGGVDLKRVAADYRQLVGEPLPIREQGFTDVTSFLKAYPDVAQIVEMPGGIKVKGIDEQHALTHVNATARKALYQPDKDKPITDNVVSVFIGNLPTNNMSEDVIPGHLERLLANYKVFDLRLHMQKGCAHIETTSAVAQRMFKALRGTHFLTRTLIVDIAHGASAQAAADTSPANSTGMQQEQKSEPKVCACVFSSQNMLLPLRGKFLIPRCPWSSKVMEFRKTIFQAWKVMENNKGHGK